MNQGFVGPAPQAAGLSAHSGEMQRDDRQTRIVVAEDNGAISSFISDVLRDELGWQPIVVGDGAKALQVVQEDSVDVILLDIDLPGLSGLEVYDRMRADPRTWHIPVVLMSAACHTTDLVERSITSFLRKPFDLDDLIKIVSNQLAH